MVIYVGAEFTRLIFMRGEHFHQFAPIIGEGYDSPNLQNTVYSRLLLEQDNLAIPHIRRIILAGECKRIGFQEFLSQQLPDQEVEYLRDAASGCQQAERRTAGPDFRIRRSHRRGVESPGPAEHGSV